jgi:RNA-directed DNA polymerase
VSVPPSHLYRREALRLGRDEATVDRVLEVEASVAGNGAFPVYTLNHLAAITGASWRYLREIVSRKVDPYLDISRPKGDGSTRPISSPEPVLMDVQRWILREILPACRVDRASYAYQRDRSIVECANRHLGSRWLVKLDIHDFFDSIFEGQVFRLFVTIGYPRLLSLELARLCTRPNPETSIHRRHSRYRGKAPYAVNVRGRLPQGGPTSGALANAVMLDADAELRSLAQKRGLEYTRYSDDLTFSTGGDFSREQGTALISRVGGILERHGFALHRAKTRILPPGARKVVLGLLVGEDRVRLLPEFKRRIEVHVRGVAKFGVVEHARHRHFDSVLSMINHVDGCIAFAESVDAAFADNARERWSAALRAGGYTLGTS